MTDEKKLEEKEIKLRERLASVKALEDEIKTRENALKQKEKARKQIVLRLSPSLWEQLSALAERDFRSINGEIEYLLTQAIKDKKEEKK